MKKINTILIVFLLALFCGNLAAQIQPRVWSYYAGSFIPNNPGNGTPEKPYIISSGEELAYLALMVRDDYTNFSGKHYQLGADIELIGSRRWDVAIGNAGKPFWGSFDGGKFRIFNMITNEIGSVGLFGETSGAVIKNVTIENCVINNAATAGSLIGTAHSNTVIENCHVKGYQLSNISTYAGGLIGISSEITVKKCSSSGKIAGSGEYTGGFTGYSMYAEFMDCFSEGIIGGANTGGFAGTVAAGKNLFQNCFSTSRSNGTKYTGGFIGWSMGYSTASIIDCRASGAVVGVSGCVGGFIGMLESTGAIQGCLAEGQVTGLYDYVGGFIGRIENTYNSTVISDCRATGSTEALYIYSGGFIGYCGSKDISITRCYAEGPVIGADYAGGFMGYTSFAIPVSNCYAYGAVSGNDHVGGFGGRIFGTFTDCYSIGNVEGNENVGGFIGYIYITTECTDCYAVGAVHGNNYVGGFIGYVYNSLSLTSCFSAATILCENSKEADKLYGAFIGDISTTGNYTFHYTNCYFDKQMAGLDDASGTSSVMEGIEALSTAEMTKNSLSGFSDKWLFASGYYPQLKVFAQSKDAATRLRSALSAVPLKLANNTETAAAVQTEIHLAEKTPTGDVITWSADAVTINDFAWNKLTLNAGDASRNVFFRSKSMTAANNYLGVLVGNNFYNAVPAQFSYAIPCGAEEESVVAEIVLGGYASCTPATTLTLYANQPQIVTATTADGQNRTYTFTAKKPLPPDIFVQRWSDVLAINNNFVTNGGYNFIAYEWYKNGNQLPGTQGFIQEPGGLSKLAEYTAVVTTQQGDQLGVCPAKISDMPSQKMAVYPNPARSGQTIRVETGIESNNAVMQLFNATGNLVAKQTLNAPVAELTAPDTSGTYVLQITVNGVAQTYKIAVE